MFYTARHVVLAGGLVGALSDGDLQDRGALAARAGEGRAPPRAAVPLLALLADRVGSPHRAGRGPRGELPARNVAPGLSGLWAAGSGDRASGVGPSAPRPAATRRRRVHTSSALGIARAIRSPYAEFMARRPRPSCLDGGREADGLQSLSAAMALGREHGCVNSQVWIPAVMARLCSRALEANIEVDYVRALVVKRELVGESRRLTSRAWPWPIKIFTLGRFEVLLDGEPVRFSAQGPAQTPGPAQGADRVRRSHRARGSRAG